MSRSLKPKQDPDRAQRSRTPETKVGSPRHEGGKPVDSTSETLSLSADLSSLSQQEELRAKEAATPIAPNSTSTTRVGRGDWNTLSSLRMSVDDTHNSAKPRLEEVVPIPPRRTTAATNHASASFLYSASDSCSTTPVVRERRTNATGEERTTAGQQRKAILLTGEAQLHSLGSGGCTEDDRFDRRMRISRPQETIAEGAVSGIVVPDLMLLTYDSLIDEGGLNGLFQDRAVQDYTTREKGFVHHRENYNNEKGNVLGAAECFPRGGVPHGVFTVGDDSSSFFLDRRSSPSPGRSSLPTRPAPYVPDERRRAGHISASNSDATSMRQTAQRASTTPERKSRKKEEESDGRWSKRFTWSDDLHHDFVSAIFDVGLKHASASKLLDRFPKDDMNITSEMIDDYLQKYRVHHRMTRKLAPNISLEIPLELRPDEPNSRNNIAALPLSEAGASASSFIAEKDIIRRKDDDNDETHGETLSSNTDRLAVVDQHSRGRYFQPTSPRAGSAERPMLAVPRLLIDEKESPVGASMGYLMALFVSLNQQLVESRGAVQRGGGEEHSRRSHAAPPPVKNDEPVRSQDQQKAAATSVSSGGPLNRDDAITGGGFESWATLQQQRPRPPRGRFPQTYYHHGGRATPARAVSTRPQTSDRDSEATTAQTQQQQSAENTRRRHDQMKNEMHSQEMLLLAKMRALKQQDEMKKHSPANACSSPIITPVYKKLVVHEEEDHHLRLGAVLMATKGDSASSSSGRLENSGDSSQQDQSDHGAEERQVVEPNKQQGRVDTKTIVRTTPKSSPSSPPLPSSRQLDDLVPLEEDISDRESSTTTTIIVGNHVGDPTTFRSRSLSIGSEEEQSIWNSMDPIDEQLFEFLLNDQTE